MWLSGEERHKYRQVVWTRLRHNCNHCKECSTHAVLMVHIRHHIPGTKSMRDLCNTTCPIGEGKRVILCPSVSCSLGAIKADPYSRVFEADTRVTADAAMLSRRRRTAGRTNERDMTSQHEFCFLWDEPQHSVYESGCFGNAEQIVC
jgi:hypothetical protein